MTYSPDSIRVYGTQALAHRKFGTVDQDVRITVMVDYWGAYHSTEYPEM